MNTESVNQPSPAVGVSFNSERPNADKRRRVPTGRYNGVCTLPRPEPGQFKTRADYEKARGNWKAAYPNFNTREEEDAHIEVMKLIKLIDDGRVMATAEGRDPDTFPTPYVANELRRQLRVLNDYREKVGREVQS
jgi:hypothetical protein